MARREAFLKWAASADREPTGLVGSMTGPRYLPGAKQLASAGDRPIGHVTTGPGSPISTRLFLVTI